MPNWTMNEIEMDGIASESELFTENHFDFNKLIPMPKELNDTISGGRIDECVAYYLLKTQTKDEFLHSLRKYKLMFYTKKSYTKKEIEKVLLSRIGDNPRMYGSEMYDSDELGNGFYKEHDHGHTAFEVGQKYFNLYEKYGYFNWYNWSIDNWGVKWNASDTYVIDENTISFDTPWGSPEPIFIALSHKYPDREIKTTSYYEDGGCLRQTYLRGVITSEEYEEEE